MLWLCFPLSQIRYKVSTNKYTPSPWQGVQRIPRQTKKTWTVGGVAPLILLSKLSMEQKSIVWREKMLSKVIPSLLIATLLIHICLLGHGWNWGLDFRRCFHRSHRNTCRSVRLRNGAQRCNGRGFGECSYFAPIPSTDYLPDIKRFQGRIGTICVQAPSALGKGMICKVFQKKVSNAVQLHQWRNAKHCFLTRPNHLPGTQYSWSNF
jgi:hypothetical protein